MDYRNITHRRWDARTKASTGQAEPPLSRRPIDFRFPVTVKPLTLPRFTLRNHPGAWDDPLPLRYGVLWRCLHWRLRFALRASQPMPVSAGRMPQIDPSRPSSGIQPSVTIVLPCPNEVRCIDLCLESVLQSAYPADRITGIIADSMSDGGTRDVPATCVVCTLADRPD